MRGILMIKIIVCLVAFSLMPIHGNENMPNFESLSDAGMGVEKDEKIHLYGHEYMVKAFRTNGTSVKWSEVKSYVPQLLEGVESKTLSKSKLILLLRDKIGEDGKKFSKFVSLLAKEIASYLPGEDPEVIELELADYLVVNRSDILIEQFGTYDKSMLVPQISKAQELHNKYILLVYLEKMVTASK